MSLLTLGSIPSSPWRLGAAIYAHMLETGQQMKTIQKENATPQPDDTPLEVDVEETADQTLPVAEILPDNVSSPPAPPRVEMPTVNFVTAHGVGVKVCAQGEWRNAVLIAKNSRVPHSVTRRFKTTGGSSRTGKLAAISIEITQGDTPNIELAEILGKGTIQLPQNESAGQPVDVTLEFDSQGRLHAHATYVKTDDAMSMKIDVSGGLKEEDVNQYRAYLQEKGFAKPFSPEEALAQLEDDDHDEDELPEITPI